MKKWILNSLKQPMGNDVTRSMNISDEIGQIMINRDICDLETVEMYVNPDISKLRNPFLMKDMEKACDRIKKAIRDKEKICIYGDYDVDGVSSTSILKIYFESIGYPVEYYIPNRLEEGYGMNIDAIEQIHKMGVDLIITVDCGITSVSEVEYAKTLGIDVIITDHHECQGEIPKAYAVLNPKRPDCSYPFKGICGCGVCLKLIHGMSGDSFYKDINKYLEIVSLATICDVMPVLDENRIIVKNGLEILGKGENIGMKSLVEICGLEEKKIKSSYLGFQIGPRINASGRLGFSKLGVELFTTNNSYKAKELSVEMDEKNQERQYIESLIYKMVEDDIMKNGYYKDKVIVVSGEGWHHGIIGIVASKITEKYYKPCILLCEEDGLAVGSARSIKGFDIFSAIYECRDLMEKFGGHNQAAGLTMKVSNIGVFRDKINKIADYTLNEEDFIEEIKIEYEISPESITLDMVDGLHILEPFGIKNPTPYFMMRDCKVVSAYKIGKEKNHLKMVIDKGKEFNCIGFSMAHLLDVFEEGDNIDIVFQIDDNTYMDNRSVQLMIKDVRVNRPQNINNPRLLSKIDKIYDIRNIGESRFGLSNKEDVIEFIKNNEEEFIVDIDDRDNIHRFYRDLSNYDDSDLIIVNTINGYFRAMSDLYTLQDKKIDLIFLSDIDKKDIKVYNKIIVYDFFDNIEEIKLIISMKKDNSKIAINFDSSDYVFLKSKYNQVLYNRDDYVSVYKYFSQISVKEVMNNYLNNDKIVVGYKFAVDIKKFLHECGISLAKLGIILEVFSMEKLIEYTIDYNLYKVFFNILPKPDKKLNLEENSIVRFLEAKNI